MSTVPLKTNNTFCCNSYYAYLTEKAKEVEKVADLMSDMQLIDTNNEVAPASGQAAAAGGAGAKPKVTTVQWQSSGASGSSSDSSDSSSSSSSEDEVVTKKQVRAS